MKYHIRGNKLYIDDCNISPKDWDEIDHLTKSGVFDECDTLHIKKAILRPTLAIDVEAFWDKIKTVVFPGDIGEEDFEYKVKVLRGNRTLTRSKYFKPETIEFEFGLVSLQRNMISNLESLKKVILPKGLGSIDDAAFEGCSNLEEVVLPDSLYSVGFGAFEGCNKLRKLRWCPEDGFNFHHAAFINSNNPDARLDVEIAPKGENYKVFASSEIGEVLGKDKDGNIHILGVGDNYNDYRGCISLKRLDKAFLHYFTNIEEEDNTVPEYISHKTMSKYKIGAKLIRQKMKFSEPYVVELEALGKLDDFIAHSDFRPFVNDVVPILSDTSIVGTYNYADYESFIKFCGYLGCFSTRPYISSTSNAETTMAQKACSFVAKAVKSQQMTIKDGYSRFHKLKTPLKPNQRLLDFLMVREAGNMFPNVCLLYVLDKKYPSLLTRVVSHFDDALDYRIARDENGDSRASWEEAFVRFFVDNKYEVKDPKYHDLALFCSRRNMTFEQFQRCCGIVDRQKEYGVPSHILGKPLKEKTIVDEIEEIEADTRIRIKHAHKLINKLYEKKFTYEFLDKHDYRGLDIGAEVDCCCTVKREAYGGAICDAAMTAPDVQHLLVNDTSGKTVGKGTLYVNAKDGYIVINEFDIIDKYRMWDDLSSFDGAVPNEKEEEAKGKNRALILDTFKRGIFDFIREYNATHKVRIRQVNIGWDHNKMKNELYTYNKAKHKLDVPDHYQFCDAEKEQRVLYKK